MACDSAIPNIPRRKSDHVEASHDTEVIASTFEGEEQVVDLVLVGVDDSAVCQDDFVVDYLIWGAKRVFSNETCKRRL
jgi:hypothetical protein